jgi:hypothetical protein
MLCIFSTNLCETLWQISAVRAVTWFLRTDLFLMRRTGLQATIRLSKLV